MSTGILKPGSGLLFFNYVLFIEKAASVRFILSFMVDVERGRLENKISKTL